MKVVDSLWFTNPGGTVGIVIVEDEVTRERRAYIGIGGGYSQESDTQGIMDWGSPLSVAALDRIKRQLTPRKPKKEGDEGAKVQEDAIGTNLDGEPLIKRPPGKLRPG